ncbi:MAG: riboflavin synthase [Halanaerobiales bacterium]
MFTGIVQEIGTLFKRIKSNNRYQLIIEASKVLEDVSKGDSIAVNGVCLTVVDYSNNKFTADVMPETLRATNLSKLRMGSRVNLEQAVRADGFFGGHIVTGHIDGTGIIEVIKVEDNAHLVEIKVTEELTNYMVDKGSVALNGVSLTIMKVFRDTLSVSLIPETWNYTNLSALSVGDEINIETDLIGKYVYKMLGRERSNKDEKSNKSGLDKDFLLKNGFL